MSTPSAPQTLTDKSFAERVSDSVLILRKILEVGAEKDSEEYLQTKVHLDAWIKTGEPGVFKIPFKTFGRVAHMTLPKYAGTEPIYVLKSLKKSC
jgi:hypothetical protein